jgi:hypothetical protein
MFDEWKAQHAEELALPKRINDMHHLYGKTPGKVCGKCAHFEVLKFGGTYFKCNLNRMSKSIATDWRYRWAACGKFEEEA